MSKPNVASKPAIRQKKKPGNPHPLPPPKEHQFKPGQSGNPSGRPKLLGESYKQWLAQVNAEGITNAEAVALAMGLQAMKGDVSAAREIRAATEGDKLTVDSWEVRLVAAIKAGEVDYESVVEEFGKSLAAKLFGQANVEIPKQE